MSADVDLERLAQRGLAEGLSDDEIVEVFHDHGVDEETARETLSDVKDQADVTDHPGHELDDLDGFEEDLDDTDDAEREFSQRGEFNDDFTEAFRDDEDDFEDLEGLTEEPGDTSVFSQLTSWFTGDSEAEETVEEDAEPDKDDDLSEDIDSLGSIEAADDQDEGHGEEGEEEDKDIDISDDLLSLAREAVSQGLREDQIHSIFTDHGISDDKADTILAELKESDDIPPADDQSSEDEETSEEETTQPDTVTEDSAEDEDEEDTEHDTADETRPDEEQGHEPDTTPIDEDDSISNANALHQLAKEGIEKGLSDDELIAFFTNNGLTDDQAKAVIEAERGRPVNEQQLKAKRQRRQATRENAQTNQGTPQQARQNRPQQAQGQPQSQAESQRGQQSQPQQPAQEVTTHGKAKHEQKRSAGEQTEARDAVTVQKEVSYAPDDEDDAFMSDIDKDRKSLEVGRIFLTGRKPSHGRMRVEGLHDLVDREVHTSGRDSFMDITGSGSKEAEEQAQEQLSQAQQSAQQKAGSRQPGQQQNGQEQAQPNTQQSAQPRGNTQQGEQNNLSPQENIDHQVEQRKAQHEEMSGDS